jgi:acetyl-CoA synthetase
MGRSYESTIKHFSWDSVLADLGWTGRDTVNLAETIIDRHDRTPVGAQTALIWVGEGSERRLSYRELSEASSRFANLLLRRGVRKSDRVAVYMPRLPETFAAILGILKTGAIFVPIFTGFGPDGIRFRLEHSGARVLVTHPPLRPQLPEGLELDIVYVSESDSEESAFTPIPCRRDEPMAVIYTSGSTGQPKGCVIAVNMLAAIWPYLRYGVDLRAVEDIFWPTGDPGWGYGLCCYLPAFAAGAQVLSLQSNPRAQQCLEILAKYRVTNIATTPTLLRSLMALEEAQVKGTPVRVRAISSCGEPLNSEVVEFFRRVWNATPMDHYGATEFSLPIGNYNAIDMPVKPGSMGLPCPGFTMAVVDESGQEVAAGEVGLVGQKSNESNRYWLGYWNDEAGARGLWRGDWVCTGDLARRDSDGYFWFEGRSNDMIKSSGYRIGPFEVESCILKHPSVAEAAVVGKPDLLRGEIVKAFVVLKSHVQASDGLADEIVRLVRQDLGRHQYPRELQFVDELPKTQTGKIQRFLLRQRP